MSLSEVSRRPTLLSMKPSPLQCRLATSLLGWAGVEEVLEEVEVKPGVDVRAMLTSAEMQVRGKYCVQSSNY